MINKPSGQSGLTELSLVQGCNAGTPTVDRRSLSEWRAACPVLALHCQEALALSSMRGRQILREDKHLVWRYLVG